MLKLEGVLNDAQIAEIRRIVEAAKFVDGTVSGKGSLKKNLQVERGAPQFDAAIRIVVGALMAREDFKTYAMPKQITLEFNRYDPGMFYKAHMDSALMGGVGGQPLRTDLSFAVYLTDPDSYRGGEFILETPFGQERIKEKAGNAIVYPSTMLHWVEPVEEGKRLSAVGWIQSMLRDESQRQIMREVSALRSETVKAFPDSDLQERFDHLQSNLMRYWAEV
jgi:PKHD-type hydroxylase